jgi:hypothetical protein
LDRLDLLDFDATSDMERSSRINGGSTRHLAKECERLTNESSNANEGNVGDSPYMVFVSTDGLTAGMFRMDDAFCTFIKLYHGSAALLTSKFRDSALFVCRPLVVFFSN